MYSEAGVQKCTKPLFFAILCVCVSTKGNFIQPLLYDKNHRGWIYCMEAYSWFSFTYSVTLSLSLAFFFRSDGVRFFFSFFPVSFHEGAQGYKQEVNWIEPTFRCLACSHLRMCMNFWTFIRKKKTKLNGG